MGHAQGRPPLDRAGEEPAQERRPLLGGRQCHAAARRRPGHRLPVGAHTADARADRRRGGRLPRLPGRPRRRADDPRRPRRAPRRDRHRAARPRRRRGRSRPHRGRRGHDRAAGRRRGRRAAARRAERRGAAAGRLGRLGRSDRLGRLACPRRRDHAGHGAGHALDPALQPGPLRRSGRGTRRGCPGADDAGAALPAGPARLRDGRHRPPRRRGRAHPPRPRRRGHQHHGRRRRRPHRLRQHRAAGAVRRGAGRHPRGRRTPPAPPCHTSRPGRSSAPTWTASTATRRTSVPCWSA